VTAEVDWTQVLLEQFDLEWNLAHGPSLETLTDEEYVWEPVPGCWSIRPTGPGGRGEFDQTQPDPEPAPVTTIAWRLSHLAVGVFGLRSSHHFGDGSLTHANAERPLTAKEGVAYFKEQALQWRAHIERLDEEAPPLWQRGRVSGAGESEDRAARGHLDGGHAPAEQHDEPIAVAGAKQAGVLGQGRDDVLGGLVRIGRAGVVVADVQEIAADKPDAQHNFSHGHAS
jgi:hypothetical protein